MGFEKGSFGLIRHAKTELNLQNRVQGTTDNSATPQSLNEMREFARTLRERNLNFSRIYTSDLQRTIETGEVFQEELGIRSAFIEPRFRDRGQGDLEGKTYEEADILEGIEGIYLGEERSAFRARVLIAHCMIQEREVGSNILYITHSAVAKVILESEGHKLSNGVFPNNVLVLISDGQAMTIR